jgi:hypothetical protein
MSRFKQSIAMKLISLFASILRSRNLANEIIPPADMKRRTAVLEEENNWTTKNEASMRISLG